MSKFILAQLNIAKMKVPLEFPSMKDFVDNLDRINTLAEQSPGFVWRLKDEDGNATTLRPFGDEFLVNISAWKDVASLSDFAYASAHVEIMRRRREWFEAMVEAYAVLWWIPETHRPTLIEAAERLALIRKSGSNARVFSFKEAFPAPDATEAEPNS